MKVLILGGTGTMGSPLADELVNSCDDVWVLCRSRRENHKDTIHYIYGDFADAQIQQEISSQKWDVIVDFLWHNEKKYFATYKLLAEITNHYVFLSSAAVYAKNDEPMNEDSSRFLDNDTTGSDEYHLQKARMEDIIFNSEYDNWTIVRPHITFNVDRMPLVLWEENIWLNRFLENKKIVLTNEILNKKTNFTYGPIIAKQIKAIIYSHETFQQIYNVASSNTYTWRELINKIDQCVYEKTNRNLPIIILDKSNKYFDLIKYLPHKADRLKHDRLLDRVVDVKKISNLTGDVEEYEIDEAIKKCFEKKYNESSKMSIEYDDPISIAFMDRVSGEYTSINCFNRGKDKLKYILLRYCLTYSIALRIYCWLKAK